VSLFAAEERGRAAIRLAEGRERENIFLARDRHNIARLLEEEEEDRRKAIVSAEVIEFQHMTTEFLEFGLWAKDFAALRHDLIRTERDRSHFVLYSERQVCRVLELSHHHRANNEMPPLLLLVPSRVSRAPSGLCFSLYLPTLGVGCRCGRYSSSSSEVPRQAVLVLH